MRKQGGTPSGRDKYVMLAAISRPCVARGLFVRGHQSGLAGCKSPPLFKRGASSCSPQRQRQGEPWGASPRLSAPTYLPIYIGFAITLVSTRETHSRAGTNLRTKGLEIFAYKLWPMVGAYLTRGSEPINPAFHYQMGRYFPR